MHFLYKNFLINKRVYSLNQNWYVKLVEKITHKKPSLFYNNQFNNGEKDYDGNPVFSTKLGNRLLRIIQEKPESNTPFLTAWVDTATDKNINELVISLELSNATKPLLEKLIKKWLVEKVDEKIMEGYIKQVIN